MALERVLEMQRGERTFQAGRTAGWETQWLQCAVGRHPQALGPTGVQGKRAESEKQVPQTGPAHLAKRDSIGLEKRLQVLKQGHSMVTAGFQEDPSYGGVGWV